VFSGACAMVFVEEDGVIVRGCRPFERCWHFEHMYLDADRPYVLPVPLYAYPIVVGEYYSDLPYEE